MAKLISKTYADALFELAIEENQTVSFRQEVESLQQILRDNEEFHKFMNHPKIPKEEKKAALENIFRGRGSRVPCGAGNLGEAVSTWPFFAGKYDGSAGAETVSIWKEGNCRKRNRKKNSVRNKWKEQKRN